MNRFDRLSDYKKNALKRFADATELLDAPTANPSQSDADVRHLRAAMYLAGYGAECILKAYICDQQNSQSLAAAVESINKFRKDSGRGPIRDIATTSAGHNIDYLVRLTDIVERKDYDAALWGRLAKWSSGWRYNHTPVDRKTAVAFVQDVGKALNWLRPKLLGV